MTAVLDLERMHSARFAKIQAAMSKSGVDVTLLLTSGNVTYATGAWRLAVDNGRGFMDRTVALVAATGDAPHIFTSYVEGVPDDIPSENVHPAINLDSRAGVIEISRMIRDLIGSGKNVTVAVDDYTMPMWFDLESCCQPASIVAAGPLLSSCRLHKTPDELECLRRSWRMSEEANMAVEQTLRPGLQMTELTRAFLARLFELGEHCNFLDPVFQAMPMHIADGPWSTNGDVPFTLQINDRILRDGDVIWTDTVSGYHGYASDIGRTWVVGQPTPEMHSAARRWIDLTAGLIDMMKPGVSGADMTRYATDINDGVKPWLEHFFLGHTLGIEGSEDNRFGSDAGQAVDEAFILEPGMVIVVEPVIWVEGSSGYRCEELIFITDDGHERVSSYPDQPFEEAQ